MKQKGSEVIVYLDLDDVLVDWTGKVMAMGQERYGQPLHSAESDKEFVARMFSLNMHQWIDEAGPEFWEYLPPMPQSQALLDLVSNLKRDGKIADWFILTNPTSFLHSYEGKRRWLLKHTGCAHKHIVTSNKHLLAKPGTILIDDLPENCALFKAYGGEAFLFPPRCIMYAKDSRMEIRNIAAAIARVCESCGDGIS